MVTLFGAAWCSQTRAAVVEVVGFLDAVDWQMRAHKMTFVAFAFDSQCDRKNGNDLVSLNFRLADIARPGTFCTA